ncbi:MAG: extracellular solute-binding protein [Vallitalea sp.]|nr:extracellular solute-binding protein [Vallitalea sp.]
MRYRVIGMYLYIIVIVVMLCSCSNMDSTTYKDESANVTTNSTNTNTDSQKQDKVTTLTLVQKDFSPYNNEDNEYIQEINKTLIENNIQAKLELVELPKGDYSEQLKNIIDSGNAPDIIWFRDGMDKDISNKGQLVNLTKYVNDSDVFQNSMESYHKTRIQNYPYLLRIRYNTPKIAAVRKDWLDSLSLSVPVTVDDYYNVLKAFANSDFDDNGKKDTYGITATGDTTRLDDVFNTAFGLPTTWVKNENDSYVYSRVTHNEKEKLLFYRKLMEEHILDPNYGTTKWDTMEEKLYNGKVGMIIGSSGKVIDIYNRKLIDNEVNTELIALHPPKGKEGLAGFAPINVNGEERGFAISSTCENIDLAFTVLEFMASDKGQFLDRLGIEGREYNIDSNGKVICTNKANQWYARFFDVPSWESPIPLLSEIAKQSLQITESYYIEDNSFNIPKEYKSKWESMNKLYREYSYKIISGEYELNKFDEFVDKWYMMGGKEITELANKTIK